MRAKILAALVATTLGSALAAAEPEADPEALRSFPALSPQEALKSFEIAPGYRVELAAAEPQVVDPIAVAFDDHGALYVVEMRDYSEHRADRLSRIRRLTDEDGDGFYETSTVFLDGLAWASGIACQGDRVFLLATPDLMVARDTQGDGVADERKVLLTGFGAGLDRLNVQALPNSLTWGPDGRLHGATAANGGQLQRVENGMPVGRPVNFNGLDFSFDPETGDLRPDGPTSQYGLSYDALGRKFVCSNSHHLQWVPFRGAGPGLIDIPVDGPAAPVFRISPDEPWRVMRTNWRASGLVSGLIEGGGRPSGYFTSACGVHVSRGMVENGDVFVCDVGSNLVHRKRLRETFSGPVAERVPGEEQREFLASRDTWFRPVALADGPDGALYVVDMYREIVEHPWSLPPGIKQHLNLDNGNDRGRIWRIVPDTPPAKIPPAGWPQPRTPEEIRAALASADPIQQAAGLRAFSATKNPAAFAAEIASLVEHAGPALCNEVATTLARSSLPQRVDWLAALHQRGVPLDALLPGLHDAADQGAFAAKSTKLSPAARLDLFSRLEIAPDKETQSLARQSLDNPELQLAALTILARGEPGLAEKLALDPDRDESLRAAALRLLPPSFVPTLDQWAEFPPALQSTVMDRLLASPGGAATVLAAITGKSLPAEALTAAQTDSLRNHPVPEIRTRALAVFGAPEDRAALIARLQPALTMSGDPARGREIFLQLCATCHRDGKDGSAVGPDRETFQNKGKPLLLAAIIDPNSEVAPQYAVTTAVTIDGQTHLGLIAHEDAERVLLRQPGGEEIVLPRAEIKSLTASGRSLMPEGLENGLDNQSLADLLEFLIH